MKVAMIGLRGLDDGLGGVEKAVREISTRLVRRGVDVTCYCRPKYNDRSEYEGVKLVNTRTVYTKHGETAFYVLGSVYKAIRAQYDVVHLHALASCVAAGFIRRFSSQTRLVSTIHGLDWQRAKWGRVASGILQRAEREAVRWSDHIICVSLSLQIYCQLRYPRQLFSAIPNGCDPPSKKIAPPPFGLEPEGYILFLGRIVPEKGVHYLIKAFQNVETDKKLIIAGPAPHAEGYRREIEELARADKRVQLVGPVKGAQKDALLANSYLFVLPSEIEGLPIALLEAASNGICPLVSSIPTAIEALGTQQAARGFVAEAGAIEQLENALQIACETPELVRELGDAAREYTSVHYDWDRITDQTLDVYQRALRQERRK